LEQNRFSSKSKAFLEILISLLVIFGFAWFVYTLYGDWLRIAGFTIIGLLLVYAQFRRGKGHYVLRLKVKIQNR